MKAEIENGFITLKNSREEPAIQFPVKFMEEYLSLDNAWALEEAAFLYQALSHSVNSRWVTPEEIVNENLTGWSVCFFVHNWEDSGWESEDLIYSIIKEKENSYKMITVLGETIYNTLQTNQDILLVQQTETDYKTLTQETLNTYNH